MINAEAGNPIHLKKPPSSVTDIRGTRRVTGVTVSKVDEKLNPIPGTEIDFECDTLLLSVGLLPENELTKSAGIRLDPRTRGAEVFENRETSLEGVFACGNVLHVHDLVDYVSEESEYAGKAAAEYVLNGEQDRSCYTVRTSGGVTYTVPQKIRKGLGDRTVRLYLRVNRALPKASLVISRGGEEIVRVRRMHLAPGEMQTIDLKASLLDEKGTGDEITVSLEE